MLDQLQRDILLLVREKRVRFIQLQFTDILGTLKNVSITHDYLPQVLQEGILFDGSSIEGFTRIYESDMYLQPDLTTFTILPWQTEDSDVVARLICDVYTPTGEPFSGCPRHALKRVISEAAAAGYTLYAGPEPEFFLFETDEQGKPSKTTHDKGGYFDLTPVDRGEAARQSIVKALEQMHFQIEASHHEVAPGQHEIDFRFADALTAADNLITFKFVTKHIARRHGLYATFIPKPFLGESGSGLHIHQSLQAGERNLFADPEAEYGLSDLGRHYMGGLLEHARALTAITNPTVNSYKRLTPGYEAPIDVTWSAHNRSSLVRVPSVKPDGTRIEYRSPDPAANPYLALAVMLKAGLDGIQNERDPGPPITGTAYDLSAIAHEEQGIAYLPDNLKEALECLQTASVVHEALGDHILEHFLKAKLIEWGIYRNQIHPWELEQYLETV